MLRDGSGRSGSGTAVTVNNDRLERVLAAIRRDDDAGAEPLVMRLCQVCTELLPIDGAGLSMMTTSLPRRVAASDPLAGAVEDLQASTEEGPCFDAMATVAPVLARDLEAHEWSQRWPRFTDGALDLGARALFGFPLHVDGEPVGALDLYRDRPGGLDDAEIDSALIVAGLAAMVVGAERAEDAIAFPPAQFDTVIDEPWALPASVHHAAGMTSVQLGVSIDEALVRLSAYAFATGRALRSVADDVVTRRFRLEPWSDDRA